MVYRHNRAALPDRSCKRPRSLGSWGLAAHTLRFEAVKPPRVPAGTLHGASAPPTPSSDGVRLRGATGWLVTAFPHPACARHTTRTHCCQPAAVATAYRFTSGSRTCSAHIAVPTPWRAQGAHITVASIIDCVTTVAGHARGASSPPALRVNVLDVITHARR